MSSPSATSTCTADTRGRLHLHRARPQARRRTVAICRPHPIRVHKPGWASAISPLRTGDAWTRWPPRAYHPRRALRRQRSTASRPRNSSTVPVGALRHARGRRRQTFRRARQRGHATRCASWGEPRFGVITVTDIRAPEPPVLLLGARAPWQPERRRCRPRSSTHLPYIRGTVSPRLQARTHPRVPDREPVRGRREASSADTACTPAGSCEPCPAPNPPSAPAISRGHESPVQRRTANRQTHVLGRSGPEPVRRHVAVTFATNLFAPMLSFASLDGLLTQMDDDLRQTRLRPRHRRHRTSTRSSPPIGASLPDPGLGVDRRRRPRRWRGEAGLVLPDRIVTFVAHAISHPGRATVERPSIGPPGLSAPGTSPDAPRNEYKGEACAAEQGRPRTRSHRRVRDPRGATPVSPSANRAADPPHRI